jgi:hypothetical protein
MKKRARREEMEMEKTEEVKSIAKRPLWRFLKGVAILLWTIVFLFLLVTAGNYFSKKIFGVGIDISNGDSMLPTIDDFTLSVWRSAEKAPFEELKVGDIIIFKEQKRQTFVSSGVISSNFSVVVEKGDYGEVEKGDYGEEEKVEVEEKKDEVTPEPAPEKIEYTDTCILHRIIRIDEEGVFTQGDHNKKPDPFSVPENAYVGLITQNIPYLGAPVRFMIRWYPWMVGVACVFSIGLVFLWNLKVAGKEEEPSNQDQRNSL